LVHVPVRPLKTSIQTYAEPREGAVRRRVDARAVRLGLAAAFAGAAVAAYVGSGPSHIYVLFLLVVPISLLGEEFGIRAGLTAAALALVLATVVADQKSAEIGPTRVLTWAVVFMTASGVLRFLSPKAESLQDHPGAVAAGAGEGAQQDEAALQVLSPREVEILGLLAEGASNAQIAQRLVISAGTVKSHVHQILHKLGAANRTEAAFIYHRARPSTGR